MKKIIFLLLFTTFAFSQDPCVTKETRFDKIKLNCKIVGTGTKFPVMVQNTISGDLETIPNNYFATQLQLSLKNDKLFGTGRVVQNGSVTTYDNSPLVTSVNGQTGVVNINIPTSVQTNLSYTASTTNGFIVNSNGTNATIPLANANNSGLLSPTDFNKLQGNFTVADATTTEKGILKLTGDLGGTANSPTTPTSVHLTGDEVILGKKSFITSLNDAIIVENNSQNSGIFLNNSSTGSGIVLNNRSTGNGIVLNNSSTGSGIVLNANFNSTGFNYIGQNQNINTFSVDKFGNIISKSIISNGLNLNNEINNKQSTLISGINLKTINNQSLLGSENLSTNFGATFVDVFGDGINQNISANFTTVTLNNENSDISNLFNPSTYIYTVPSDGIYQITGSARTGDGSIATKQWGVGVHTSNADGSWFLWHSVQATTSGSNRTTYPYIRVGRFTAGQQLRMFSYCDALGGVLLIRAGLQIIKIAE